MPTSTEPVTTLRARRLEIARINLAGFCSQLPGHWDQVLPGTVGEAFAELHARILRQTDLSDVAPGDEYLAELLVTELADAAARFPRRPEAFAAEAMACAVLDALAGELRSGDWKLLPSGLSPAVFTLLNDWVFSHPGPDGAADALERAWQAAKQAPLRAQMDRPVQLFDRWAARFRELCRDTEPVVCRVVVPHHGGEPCDTRGLALRGGLCVTDGNLGFGVYPRTLLRWLATTSGERLVFERLGRATRHEVLTEIAGVPVDLDAEQWRTAWVLHRESGEGPYADAAAAIRAAANL